MDIRAIRRHHRQDRLRGYRRFAGRLSALASHLPVFWVRLRTRTLYRRAAAARRSGKRGGPL